MHRTRQTGRRLALLGGLFATLWGGMPAAGQGVASRPASTPAPASRPAGPVKFQPGIRIDWNAREVLVDGQVILREGPIELFACSPRTREHESIVLVSARPLHIFQAMGLIGLTPGHPPRVDIEREIFEGARGEPVEVLVRYALDGKSREEPIEHWMQRADGSPLEPQDWVFAGGLTNEEGHYVTDHEGTVVAVVDFATSLVALPQRHSDRNDELWLAPATKNIPPLKTPVTLVLRPGPLRIALDAQGRIRVGGRTLLLADLARLLRQSVDDDPARKIELIVDPDCPPLQQDAVNELLEEFPLQRRRPATQPSSSAGPSVDREALAAWLRTRASGAHTRPAERVAQSSQLMVEDLRRRGESLRERVEAAAEYASRLAEDLQEIVAPPAEGRETDN